ncbi:hypothetical protein PPERSA_08428 [Pseudocohnilembus persalinus]|uniref:Uncharacterized protein n=1 Tax=Pseudocohnilembus persalinus TaxID=266149 RepID=A0A0V0R6C2_PSEPJ|nr:hypothetical protein PPERSA_08428 [Pseudocohnilembus persalinus]|eukprot:KRX10025.1 hypothetical protein PPERSA_08428 [Pseudocohnilembus persalinus]
MSQIRFQNKMNNQNNFFQIQNKNQNIQESSENCNNKSQNGSFFQNSLSFDKNNDTYISERGQESQKSQKKISISQIRNNYEKPAFFSLYERIKQKKERNSSFLEQESDNKLGQNQENCRFFNKKSGKMLDEENEKQQENCDAFNFKDLYEQIQAMQENQNSDYNCNPINLLDEKQMKGNQNQINFQSINLNPISEFSNCQDFYQKNSELKEELGIQKSGQNSSIQNQQFLQFDSQIQALNEEDLKQRQNDPNQDH